MSGSQKYARHSLPPGVPNLPPQPLPALVDTGATESCIDSGLAMRLNLPIIDRRSVSGVHGAGAVNVHLAHVHIPSLASTLYGPFCAVDLVAGGQAHHALIGRTFLQHFTMTYDGRTGTVTVSND
jgi:predicted aspartyl protease